MVGNLFSLGNEVVQVDRLLGESVGFKGSSSTAFIATLEPIDITVSLLLGNGFNENETLDGYVFTEFEKEVSGFTLVFKLGCSNTQNRVWYLRVENDDMDSVADCDVQYIHQAQNLLNILGIEMKWSLNYEKKNETTD